MYWVRLVEPTATWPTERLAVLRSRLTASAKSGTHGLVLGASVPDELSRLHKTNARLFRRVTDSAKQLADHRVLHGLKRLSTFEVLGRKGLTGREMFLSTDLRRKMWAFTRNRRFVTQVAEKVAARVAQFAADEEARRNTIVPQLGSDVARGMRAWWKQKDNLIDDWVMQNLESAWTRELPAKRSQWPAPQSLPALRGYFAYKLARIVLNVGEGRRIEEGDYFDAEHFACSAYSNLLLTEDRRFIETCRSIGRPVPALASLDDLEAELCDAG
jgi:hypothetical protein